jgi:acetylornithine deacetylase/succinyl-diaminopimelate desuccinylase-like protein
MSRLALSDADKSARDWFVKTTKSLGCDVKVDAMGIGHPHLHFEDDADIDVGNIFAVRPGRKDGPPTYAGW